MPKVARGPKFRRGAAGVAVVHGEPKQLTKSDAAALPAASPGESRRSWPTDNITHDGRCDRPGSEDRAATSQISSAVEPEPSAANSSNSSPAGSSSRKPPATSKSVGDGGGSITNTDGLGEDHSALSRGQRKRQAKKEQYLRKERLVMASLKLRHDDDQKRRIDGLDAIRSALLESVAVGGVGGTGFERTDDPGRTGAGKGGAEASLGNLAAAPSLLKTNHSKLKLVQREAAQMSLVLQHPAFVEDPFDAIRQHLRNTAPQRGALAAAAVARAKGDGPGKGPSPTDSDDRGKEKHRVRRRKHRVKATRSKSRR